MEKFAWFAACLLFPGLVHADLYLSLGGGVFHTNGRGLQIAGEVYRNVEANYSVWEDGDRNRAASIGYRLGDGRPLSVVLGAAYVNRVTQNLLRHANAYVEIRLGPFDRFSCRIAHYSSVGDDKGENLLLCGLHWKLGSPAVGG